VTAPRNYVKFTFLKVDPAWRRRPAEEREADKREFLAACQEFGEDHLLRAYSLVSESRFLDSKISFPPKSNKYLRLLFLIFYF